MKEEREQNAGVMSVACRYGWMIYNPGESRIFTGQWEEKIEWLKREEGGNIEEEEGSYSNVTKTAIVVMQRKR